MQEQFITITEARKEIFTISNLVDKKNTVFTLTEHGIPKVILLSARKYNRLLKLQLTQKLAFPFGNFLPTRSLVQDLSSEQYSNASLLDVPTPRGDVDKLRNAKRLATAQLYVKLAEIYHYPPEHLHLDRCIRINGRHSHHSIDIDVLISDAQGNPLTLCLTAPFQKYEAWKMCIVNDLFTLHTAIRKEYQCKTLKYLVYFSHTVGYKKNEDYWTIIDVSKFSTFSEWEKGNYFSEKKLIPYSV